MSRSFGAISLITANLPGRVDLGPTWCMFNMVCAESEEDAFRQELKEKLGPFMDPESRVLFLAEGAEHDVIETDVGEEPVLLLTAFLTVAGVNVDKAVALNAALADLFGIAPDDPLSVIQELAAP
jgi:hypothetical protein